MNRSRTFSGGLELRPRRSLLALLATNMVRRVTPRVFRILLKKLLIFSPTFTKANEQFRMNCKFR